MGSRRHVGGAGDLLAYKAGHTPRLIEVKKTRTAWSNFGPADRALLLDFSERNGLEPWLAWVVGTNVRYLSADAWPTIKEA